MPFAIIERKNNKKKSPSYIIFKSFENNFSLSSFLDQTKNKNSLSSNDKKLIKDVAVFTATMHNEGIFHRDYSGQNILIRKNQTDKIEISIVDINRSRFNKNLNLTKRIQDIIRIGLNEKTLTLFLEEYAKMTNYKYSILLKKFKLIKKLHEMKNNTKQYLRSFINKKSIKDEHNKAIKSTIFSYTQCDRTIPLT